MKKETYKSKVGDTVWVRLPMNAKIVRFNKQYGYTLKTEDGAEWSYYGDDEVSVIKGKEHEREKTMPLPLAPKKSKRKNSKVKKSNPK